jgi:hypothetical protein
MPSWAAGAAGTFAISAVSAYVFLQLRCRGIGYPFGPSARWWAMAVIVITAVVATGLGVAVVAVSDHLRAVYVGVIVPSVLWLGRSPAPRGTRRGSVFLRGLVAWADAPLRRLNDSMGEDLHNWCEDRSAAAANSPELIDDLAEHYYLQVRNHLKNRDELELRLDSIRRKVALARRARQGRLRAPALQDALEDHSSTRNNRKYSAEDQDRLARRLESDAQSELMQLLAAIYRLGHRKLIKYRGYKPAPQVPQPR